MRWLAPVVIIASVAFIGTLIGVYIYKRVRHIPTGECANCHTNSNRLLNDYHKKYGKKEHGCSCCSSK